MRFADNLAPIGALTITAILAAAPVAAQPPAATGLSTSPTESLNFRWHPTSGATQYYLWITDASGGARYRRWYTAEEANCGPSQSALCDVSVSTYMSPGIGSWWIQTWSPAGYGPWSATQTFSTPQNASRLRTRLLLPFASNWAGYDMGISVANTGRDSSGFVGRAGTCTLHYFGRLANGTLANKTETTTAIAPGETLAFTLSTGNGTYGLQGYPGFQGYIEFNCTFPFGHGFAFMTNGPIGSATVGSTVPMLVLPAVRSTSLVESAGQ